MAIKLVYLNAKGLRDRSKVAHLLRDLMCFSVGVAAI